MRKFLAAILLFFTFTTLCAEEMELWCNDRGAGEFATLTVEEQYNSYINSFKKIKDPREQPMKWANRMVKQYGRDVIPLMNDTISKLTFDHVYKKPYDSTFHCIFFLIDVLIKNNIFTNTEKELYSQLFQAKIDNYILKYKLIDGTVKLSHSILNILQGFDTRKESAETWLNYYEERLGVYDIEVTDINERWQ